MVEDKVTECQLNEKKENTASKNGSRWISAIFAFFLPALLVAVCKLMIALEYVIPEYEKGNLILLLFSGLAAWIICPVILATILRGWNIVVIVVGVGFLLLMQFIMIDSWGGLHWLR